MSASSSIEWTDATWNPSRGCTRVSEGCRNCYAEVMAARFSKSAEEVAFAWVNDPANAGKPLPNFVDQWGHGFAEMKGGDHRWTGKVALIDEQLNLPFRWKKPRRIFVNSTSDLFHEALSDDAIDRVFDVMASAHWHTFQVLTKRPDRMQRFLSRPEFGTEVAVFETPLPNVWLGTSVEDQATADERIPHLLQTPAASRFVSYEPALGPVSFRWANWDEWEDHARRADAHAVDHLDGLRMLDWIIMGGESGSGARPMHPDWVRKVRDECSEAGVPFFFKQWGEWGPDEGPLEDGTDRIMGGRAECASWDGHSWKFWENGYAPTFRYVMQPQEWVYHLGKKATGRLLDGVEHNGFPEPQLAREAA